MEEEPSSPSSSLESLMLGSFVEKKWCESAAPEPEDEDPVRFFLRPRDDDDDGVAPSLLLFCCFLFAPSAARSFSLFKRCCNISSSVVGRGRICSGTPVIISKPSTTESLGVASSRGVVDCSDESSPSSLAGGRVVVVYRCTPSKVFVVLVSGEPWLSFPIEKSILFDAPMVSLLLVLALLVLLELLPPNEGAGSLTL